MTSTGPRLVIRGARHPGDIAIEDGRVSVVGVVEPAAGDVVLASDGAVVTPGLVDAHNHLFQRMTRGVAADSSTWEWLRQLWPRWARMTVEDIGLAAEVALGELALAGTTLVADHHYLVPGGDDAGFDAIADAARRIGVRLCLGRGAIDRPGLVPESMVEDTDAALVAMAALVERVHDGDHITVALAPGSLAAASPALISGAAELARRLDLRLHTHLGEVRAEIDACLADHGVRPLQLYEDSGWLDGRAWLAHGIHFDPDERRRLAKTSTAIAHCPSSNAQTGAGICAVGELLRAGVSVGLGTDGGAVNQFGLLADARMAAYVARVKDERPEALSARTALSLATAGGAQCVGRPDLGRLEVGASADLAVWGADDLADIDDAISGLVLGPDRPVKHLVVGGEVVVRDGELTSVDLRESVARLNMRAKELLSD